MPSFESEKLQETLLDLLRSQEREKQLRDENAAILAGMSAMAGLIVRDRFSIACCRYFENT